MLKRKSSIVFVNQVSGYLMIDIINEHASLYDEIILLTGLLNPRNKKLHPKVKVVKLVAYNRTSTLKRLVTWSLFFLQTFFLLLVKYRRHSLYLVSNPPLNIIIAHWMKRPLAYLIYDVYPHILVTYGIIKEKSWVFNSLNRINQSVINKAKEVFTLSNGMKELISEGEVALEKIKVVPIWTDNTFFKKIEKRDNLFIQKYNLQNRFLVVYSGNLGKTHPIEVVLELATKCKDIPELLFLIIGEGEKKKRIEELKKKRKIQNVKILPFQPVELFSHSLSAVDLGIVTLDSQAGHLSVPSKTFNLMSVSTPILAVSDNNAELSKLIRKHQIGRHFEESNIEGMVHFIKEIMYDVDYYKELSLNSFRCSENFTPENAKKMLLK